MLFRSVRFTATPAAAAARPPKKGALNMKIAAVLFAASALFELASLTTRIPLFGAVRGGAIAALYHLVFVGVFGALAVGLWYAKRWGHKAALAATIFYTLDRTLFLFDRSGREAHLSETLAQYSPIVRPLLHGQDLLDVFPVEAFMWSLTLATVISVACWWGFAGWVHYRRAYFDS